MVSNTSTRKGIVFMVLILGLFVSFGSVARANFLHAANATVTCTDYTLSLQACALKTGTSYTIDYSIDPSCSSDITGSFMFTAKTTTNGTSTCKNDTFTKTITASPSPPFPLTGSCSLSGTATMVHHNTIPIVFSANPVVCPSCTAMTSNSQNFNAGTFPAGDYIWFNANFTASGIPSSGTTVFFQNSTITFTANGKSFSLEVPSGEIVFSPSATCASTSFDTSTNTWVTTLPTSGDDEIWLTGLAFKVPTGGLPGSIMPVTWNGTFGSTTPGVSMQWKWGAALYGSSFFNAGYDGLGVKAGHNDDCTYNNGDHAGTPEMAESDFIGGAGTGGGGSNFTGSFSGTISVTPVCP